MTLEKRLKEENEQLAGREKQLEATRPDSSHAGADISLPANQQDKRVADNAAFDKKIYLFPEEFNALRRELEENWPHFFTSVNPLDGTSPAWCMVFNAPQFVGYCNGATGLDLQFDSNNVAGICKAFLNAFRKMRGISSIN
jgi:hypothetical protein